MKLSSLVMSLVLGLGLALAAHAEPRLTLTEVLREASVNLDVAVARSGLAAARADILAADHAPLPVLTLKSSQMDLQHGIGPGNLLADKHIDKSVGVDWTWERGNKRALRTAVAQAAAQAAEGDLEDMRRQQLGLTWSAYVDLLAAQQREREVGELRDSAETLLDVMRKRHAAGDIAAQDLARAEIETTRARMDLAAAARDRRLAGVALARLMGRGQEGVSVDDASWPLGPTPDPVDDSQRGAVLARRPDVRAAQARADAARSALDGVLATRKADPTFGISVDHYPGTSTRLVELRLQLPLQIGYSQQGEIGRAQAQLQQAEDLATRARLMAEADFNQAWQTLNAAATALSTHDQELLPRAHQVLAQAELAYRKGAMPLTDLIDARRSLRAAVLDELQAKADLARAQGVWRLLTAPDLNELP